MEKILRRVLIGGCFLLVVILMAMIISPNDGVFSKIYEKENASYQKEQVKSNIDNIQDNKAQEIDFDDYNFQFAEGSVERILDNLIGKTGKVAFYLPPTDYINVSPGEDFGVAFALSNPNPDPNGDNYFEYEFTVDSSTMESCGVSKSEAESWISMGHNSFGKIPKGWIDKMTVYFIFPRSVSDCTAKFNFNIVRDKQYYGSEQITFNIQ